MIVKIWNQILMLVIIIVLVKNKVIRQINIKTINNTKN